MHRPEEPAAPASGAGDMPPEEFRAHAHAVVDWITDYLASVEQFPVLAQVEPGQIAGALAADAPERPASMQSILGEFQRTLMPGVTHWNHPSFFAYFAISGSGPGILGEMLSAALNVNAMLWRTGPAATELEERALDWLRQMIGLPEAFRGTIQDTASISSLTAIAAAREAALPAARHDGLSGQPRLRLYCSEEAHSSIEKAAITLGVGRAGTRRIPVDAEFRMDPVALRAAIEEDRAAGWLPFCVVATVGTTSTTSVDPVAEIAEICRAHDLWLHVDAAYGGAAAVAPEMRWVLDGCDGADSLVVNPHKWLFVPVDCSALFVRRPELVRRAFSIVPEYLTTPEGESVTNLMDYGPALGRRFRSLKLWMTLSYFGREGIAARVREHIRLAALFAGCIDGQADWERLAPAPFSTVAFRFRPPGVSDADADAINERILAAVNATGEVFLSHTRLRGRYALRLAVGNLRTTERHVAHAWVCCAGRPRRARPPQVRRRRGRSLGGCFAVRSTRPPHRLRLDEQYDTPRRPAFARAVSDPGSTPRPGDPEALGSRGACHAAPVIGTWTGAIHMSAAAALALAFTVAVVNGLAAWNHRAGRFRPFHFWTVLALDSLVLAGFVAALGAHGYLILPILVFAVGGYALGLPAAARVQLVGTVLAYPVARMLGLQLAGLPPATGVIVLETSVLALNGWLAMGGPVAVTVRLKRARVALARMDAGDFTTQLSDRHLDDLGFLSVDVNRLARSTGGVIAQVQEQALTLSALADELAAMAEEVHASAAGVGVTTGEMARKADAQLALSSSGCVAVDKVVADSQQLLGSATASAADAGRLAADAAKQRQLVERAGVLLVDVGDDVRRSTASVALLERAGSKIGGFVDAIQQIARQTHLLALNAAMEAARAGEHGRGFTVVAEEVGKLAKKAGGSAREVATVVDELHTAIGEVRTRLHQGGTRIADISAAAEQSRAALVSIVAGLEQTVRFIDTIAGDAGRQAGAMTGLQDQMSQIQQIAQDARCSAEETAAATGEQIASMDSLAARSQELADLAVRLNQVAARFDTSRQKAGHLQTPALY